MLLRGLKQVGLSIIIIQERQIIGVQCPRCFDEWSSEWMDLAPIKEPANVEGFIHNLQLLAESHACADENAN